MRSGMIEETYEVVEAIDNDDPKLLREELGDVLLQIAMHAEIAREDGIFDFDDVSNDICQKLIHRHPHVFGNTKAESVEAVLSNWESIKSAEKSRDTVTLKLRSIPRQLPSLMRAAKVGKKASMFDFPDVQSVVEKTREELCEVEQAVAQGDSAHIEEEIGDLLLSVASLARKCGVEPEHALGLATDKFITRFAAVEAAAEQNGEKLEEMSLEAREILWQNAKKCL